VDAGGGAGGAVTGVEVAGDVGAFGAAVFSGGCWATAAASRNTELRRTRIIKVREYDMEQLFRI
jgi:hypothetical protein